MLSNELYNNYFQMSTIKKAQVVRLKLFSTNNNSTSGEDGTSVSKTIVIILKHFVALHLRNFSISTSLCDDILFVEVCTFLSIINISYY